MRKIIFYLFILTLSFQVVFADVTADNTLSAQAVVNVIKKDPKLITLQKTKLPSSKAFEQKLLNDKKKYKDYEKTANEDYYNLYLILDKLLRANKLCYQNWRFAIKNDIENINASSSSINLIMINSSLYDSLYQNEDALAFILAHEIAHFILGHHQISLENSYKISELQKQIRDVQRETSNIGTPIAVSMLNNSINKIYEQERLLEIKADSEAVTLMARAGYDVKNGIEALNFLAKMPNIVTKRDTHPPIDIRLSNIYSELELLDIDELKNQGTKNIYDSEVLVIKKSSDKKSIIISKNLDQKNATYIPKSQENKFLECAYRYYLKNDMNLSKEYFNKAFIENSSNYITPLYLSYINEYKFLNDKDKKSLKQARYWSKKARKLSPANKNAIKQENDVLKLIKDLKQDKKENKAQSDIL